MIRALPVSRVVARFKVNIAIVPLLLVFLITGCSLFDDDGMFRNRGSDYLLSQEHPPITVPEDLDAGAIGELYRIPRIPETSVLDEADDGRAPRPRQLATSALEEEVKIQSLEERRWILINRLPGEVWPRVRNILNSNGVPTAHVDAPAGVIETVWLEFEDDSEYNHRYRFHIEQGVQPNSTEVSVLHMAMIKNGDIPAWPRVSTDVEREKTMLNVVAGDLANDGAGGTASLLAQEIGGQSKVDILTPTDTAPYILLKLDYDRSWASVGYSVSRGEFSIVDQNRSEGVLYIHYGSDEGENKPGFIRRMFGARTEKALPEANYQVRLTPAEQGVEVRVFDAEQTAVERVEALRLLKKIRASLS